MLADPDVMYTPDSESTEQEELEIRDKIFFCENISCPVVLHLIQKDEYHLHLTNLIFISPHDIDLKIENFIKRTKKK